jgi:two-component system, chemotaxis family, chemotaxis protein CheY
VATLHTDHPILIVDDHDDVRESLEMLIQIEGFAVRTARNGLEALEEMRRKPTPCVVLLDLHMPVMDGFAFRAEQRKHADLMAIPVVIFSGHHDVKAAASKLGIEAFFGKPFEIEDVMTLVSRYTTWRPRI